MLRNLQDYVVTLLRDRGGAKPVESALMMALAAVFIIAGVLAMGAIGTLFNSMSTCLKAPLNCSVSTFNLSGSSKDGDD